MLRSIERRGEETREKREKGEKRRGRKIEKERTIEEGRGTKGQLKSFIFCRQSKLLSEIVTFFW